MRNTEDLAELLKLAVEYQRVENWEQAERTYRRILAQAPHSSDVRHNLAWLLYQRGQRSAAIDELTLAVQTSPERAMFHSHLGTMLRQAGRVEEAAGCFRAALSLEPNNFAARYNLGNAYQQMGQFELAIESYRDALRGAPDDPDIHLNLALAQKELGRLDEARHGLQHALRIKPDFADAWINLGMVWKAEGDYKQAEACYQRALEVNPNSALAYNNLGSLRLGEYRPSEAIELLQKALQIKPDYATAYVNLGDAYQAQGRTAEALSAFGEALRIAPNDALKIKSALTLPVILESESQIDEVRARLRESLDRLDAEQPIVRDPATSVGAPAFYLAYQGHNEGETQTRIAQLLRRATPSLAFVAAHTSAGRAAPEERIKIGFVSQNFYAHTIGKLNVGLIQNLNRRRFQVVAFRFPGRDDPLSHKISASADRVVTLSTQLALARTQIAEQALDVLFYTDIGMDSLTYYLAHARLASVQCATWGHPLTTGIPAIDYFISSQDLEPAGAESHYTETLVRLPHLANYYFRPEPSPSTKSWSDFGFDQRSHFYVCPQSLFKLHPQDDAVFARILQQDPLATIVLIEGLQPTWEQLLRERQLKTMGNLVDRIHFVPRQSRDDFQRLLALADVLLDPLHFGGGNTSYEGFAVGTPIVTLPGGFLRSRITYALYRTMGLADCIATDTAEYVALAVRLGTDVGWRRKIQALILAENHKIYENPAGIRELEVFLCQAVASYARPAT
jgi:predicted O-linked N-acetylglucosamine transferase (SPINDLY family)